MLKLNKLENLDFFCDPLKSTFTISVLDHIFVRSADNKQPHGSGRAKNTTHEKMTHRNQTERGSKKTNYTARKDHLIYGDNIKLFVKS